MCSVLDTNIVTNNVSIDINVSDMLNSKNKLLDKINNNLSSDIDNVSIGYNLSINDIKKKVDNIKIPNKDISADDDMYLDVLESLYLLDYLDKSLDTVINNFKIVKVTDGK